MQCEPPFQGGKKRIAKETQRNQREEIIKNKNQWNGYQIFNKEN